ncbi:MAG TPA: hypothetical protein ENK21_08695 [Trueperaceae bacterium]|nr:hypothetical protein [Trueperaceae bacterium]
MSVTNWVLEAIEKSYSKGITIREIQRYIDEHHYEELAIFTLETELQSLEKKNRIRLENERYFKAKQVSKEDAFKKLFGD